MNSTTSALWSKVPKFEISKDAKIDIPAYGGRMDVRWDPGSKVTASGGLAYFALFLKTTGLFDRLCSDFPVDYRSNNSCSKRDIVGTMVLAILFGKDRYVQINALRNDTAAMELLGLGRIVSEDTVRRSLRKADDKALDDAAAAVIGKLCNLSSISLVKEKAAGAAAFLSGTTEYAVPLSNFINVEEEIKKLEADLQHQQGFLRGVMAKLGNERFVQNAKPEVVALEQKKKSDAETRIAAIEASLAALRK